MCTKVMYIFVLFVRKFVHFQMCCATPDNHCSFDCGMEIVVNRDQLMIGSDIGFQQPENVFEQWNELIREPG